MSFNSLSKQSTAVLKKLTGAKLIHLALIILPFQFSHAADAPTPAPVPAPVPTTGATPGPAGPQSEGGASSSRNGSDDNRNSPEAVNAQTCGSLNTRLIDSNSKCNINCERSISACAGSTSSPSGSSGSSKFNMIFAGVQAYSQLKGNQSSLLSGGNDPCTMTGSELRSEKSNVKREIDDIDKRIDDLQKDRLDADRTYKEQLNNLKNEERSLRSDIRKIQSDGRKLKNETITAKRAKEKELSDAKFGLERKIAQMQINIDEQKSALNKEIREKTLVLAVKNIDRISKECKNKVVAEYAKKQKENPIANVSGSLAAALSINANRLTEANQDLAMCIHDQQLVANQEIEDKTEKISKKAAQIEKLEEEVTRMMSEQQQNDQYSKDELDQIISAAKEENTALGDEVAEKYNEIKQNYERRNELLVDTQNQIKNFARVEANLSQKRNLKTFELQGLGNRPSGLPGNLTIDDAQKAIAERSEIEKAMRRIPCNMDAPSLFRPPAPVAR